MRVATIEIDGKRRPGLMRSDGAIELFSTSGDLRALIERRSIPEEPREPARPMAASRLCAPLGNPRKILCLAGNYREHVVESGFEAPDPGDLITPQVFLKPATCLSGDGDPIPLRGANVTVGWEAELAVIIGKGGRDIAPGRAMEHVFGYTILNDISERCLNSRIQGRRVRANDPFFDWLAGKWFDGFAPCGPWIVTTDEIPDPHDLAIRLWVNGELRQDGSTRAMLFRIPEQVAYLSSILTLQPGDIISTGTPAGAGLGSGETYLRDGDQVVCEIEGIGKLHNRVRSHAG